MALHPRSHIFRRRSENLGWFQFRLRADGCLEGLWSGTFVRTPDTDHAAKLICLSNVKGIFCHHRAADWMQRHYDVNHLSAAEKEKDRASMKVHLRPWKAVNQCA